MIGFNGSSDQQGQNLTRADLAAMSLISLLFGLALIAKGLFAG